MIGAHVHITKAKNKSIVGIQGTIIDESKHTIKINTQHGTKTIIKEHIEEIK